MKKFIILFIVLSTFVKTTAQSFNTEIIKEDKKPELIGIINKDALSSNTYQEWFLKNYEDYQPNDAVIAKTKSLLSQYTIKAFMGTWCGDSRKEIPRFYKILEETEFPLDRLFLVALSRDKENYKQSPGGEQEGINIHRVPTFIFYKDGIEVNRIVESPITSLEEDIIKILQGDYQSNYASVKYVNNYIKTKGLEKFSKKKNKIAKTIKPMSKSLSELNTYSSVLFSANKKEEAIAVARLNLFLYKENPDAHIRLAFKLNKTNNKEEALQLLKKAQLLDPENKKIEEYIKLVQDKMFHN